MMGYTATPEEEDIAKAIGKEIPISPKKSVEVCTALRGMNVEDAKELLEEVIEKRRIIPYRRYRKTISHKKGGVERARSGDNENRGHCGPSRSADGGIQGESAGKEHELEQGDGQHRGHTQERGGLAWRTRGRLWKKKSAGYS
jgi:hypothetical protein